MRAMRTVHPEGSRSLTAASCLLFGLVVTAAVAVAADAVRNPNHIQFGAPWPVAAELVAVVVAASLALGASAQRRQRRVGLFALEVGAALVALLLLGGVAFVLSFNQL